MRSVWLFISSGYTKISQNCLGHRKQKDERRNPSALARKIRSPIRRVIEKLSNSSTPHMSGLFVFPAKIHEPDHLGGRGQGVEGGRRMRTSFPADRQTVSEWVCGLMAACEQMMHTTNVNEMIRIRETLLFIEVSANFEIGDRWRKGPSDTHHMTEKYRSY